MPAGPPPAMQQSVVMDSGAMAGFSGKGWVAATTVGGRNWAVWFRLSVRLDALMSSAESKTIPMTAPLDAAADVTVNRFYWLKRLAVLLIVGGIGLAAIWVAWSARERRRLMAEDENWRKDHLTLDVSHLESGAVADDQNAVVSLIAAAQAYEVDSAFEQLTSGYLWNVDRPETWTPERIRILDGMLARNAKAIELLHQAATRPAVHWPRQLTGGFSVGTDFWRKISQVTSALNMEAHRAMLGGDEMTFLNDARSLHAVRRVFAGNPSMYTHMVAWNDSDLTGDLVNHYVPALNLDGPEAREGAEALLAEMLNEPATTDDLIVPLEREAAVMVDGVQASPMIENQRRMPAGVVGAVAWRVLRPAAMERTVAALVIARRDINTLRAQPFAMPGKLWNGMPPTRRPREVEPAESILLGFWPLAETADRWVGQAYNAAFSHRLACVVLACRLYRLDHEGHNPSDLAELVPKYLPAVPLDPYDKAMGQLRYTTATTRPFVYSIGASGQDRIVTGRALPRDDNARWGFNPGAFVGKGRPATRAK
jgi:hypothetical protein